MSMNDPHSSKALSDDKGLLMVNALLPDAIAREAEKMGVKKAHRDFLGLLCLAILAGAFIGFGAMISTVAQAGAAEHIPYGVTKVLSGFVFSLGLILVLLAGAQLFTGDCLMVMAWASRKLTLREMTRVWVIVWIGNFIGGAGTALFMFMTGQYMQGHGAVGETALYIATYKAALPVSQAFFLGILCNILVCLAVWLTLGARSMSDKIWSIIFPITAFIAGGGEHCVANMYYVPLGAMIERWAPEGFWHAIGKAMPTTPAVDLTHFWINLGAVTAGNFIGGALLVGGVYWLIYLRPGVQK